jgi:hypothetical protein
VTPPKSSIAFAGPLFKLRSTTRIDVYRAGSHSAFQAVFWGDASDCRTLKRASHASSQDSPRYRKSSDIRRPLSHQMHALSQSARKT